VSPNRLQANLSFRFRRLLSGDPDGVPPWLAVVAEGDEPGYFVASDAPWLVHGGFGTLVGGIRALLVQALHPGTLRGVMDHSRYAEDPLGRLSGTIRWLTVTTFASKAAVATEAERVNRMHKRVVGTYEGSDGTEVSYRAADPDLLLWVHIAFMESFLVAHQTFCTEPIPAGNAASGADNYIAQWSVAVAPLGLVACPMNQAELDVAIADFINRGILRSDDRTRQVVAFLRRPPLPGATKIAYRLLFAAAVTSLRPEYRKLLGLRAAPRWLIVPATRAALRLIKLAVGPESPVEQAARDRLARAGII
jgi:uncharacterized protein (DUF2236 family)